MKHLIITLLAFVSVTASLAQTHTFTLEGRSITVNVSSTIDTYYNESLNPNRLLEKVSCHFLMTAIRKTALYMLDL